MILVLWQPSDTLCLAMPDPKFFEIEDELVVVTEENDELSGRSVPLGKPYPPYKVINQGEEITRGEIVEKLKERYPRICIVALQDRF